ncbi:hypothetical protein, partial [Escherichia coli]|uniref:hypothetical protein n=1 Tax=Escherichia coli TaxID=562 RepID=UPI001BC853E6
NGIIQINVKPSCCRLQVILLNEFSDLRKREEGLLFQGHKKRRIVVNLGLLPGKQKLRITEPCRATKGERKLFSVFFH